MATVTEHPCDVCQGLVARLRRDAMKAAECSIRPYLPETEFIITRRFRISCPICQLLADVFSSPEYAIGSIGLYVYYGGGDLVLSRHGSPISGEKRPFVQFLRAEFSDLPSSLALGIRQGRRPDPFPPRIADPDHIPFGDIRAWLDKCRTHSDHRLSCTQPLSAEEPPRMRLLDVKSGNVLGAPEGAKYVALSYVWGQTKAPSGSLPQVVLDSMHVANALGYSFLWVDQYVRLPTSPDVFTPCPVSVLLTLQSALIRSMPATSTPKSGRCISCTEMRT